MPRHLAISLALALVFSIDSVQGSIQLSNIQLTSSSLTFDLIGTVDNVGSIDPDSFYIGEPDNNTWVNGFTSGTWTYHSGDYVPTAVEMNEGGSFGDYAYSNASSAIQIGDSVDLSFSLTGTNIAFPANTNTANWIISAGYNSTRYLPDVTAKTGGVVPEPTSVFIWGLIGFSASGVFRLRNSPPLLSLAPKFRR